MIFRFGLVGYHFSFNIRLRYVFFIITGVFWNGFSISMHIRGEAVVYLFEFFLSFYQIRIFRSIFYTVQNLLPSPAFQLSSSALFLIVNMGSFLLKHWLWSISMYFTSKLLHHGVSFWFLNSNPLALQLNVAAFDWTFQLCSLLFHIPFQDLELFFPIDLCNDLIRVLPEM